MLQNMPPGPSHAQLTIAGRDGHLDLRPPTMQTLSTVAQQAQLDHALTHRGHTPLGTAHATAYVHARDLTVAATDDRALRARDGHTPVQRRLRIGKERLPGVAVLSQPCLLCVGPEETPVHMHVGCAHSRLLCAHYRQAVREAARLLPAGDKALWVASWRSAGADCSEVFCSGLVPEAAEAQLCAIARYDPPGGTSVEDFLRHMLLPGDFLLEFRNHRLEQLLREPSNAAAWVHRWLTAGKGDCPPSPAPNLGLRGLPPHSERQPAVSAAREPHPYRDLPGGLSKHLQDSLFPPWIIGRGSMTALEAHIVGAGWARESDRWCATGRAGGPRAAVHGRPGRGMGAAHAATVHHDSQGGPRSPAGRGAEGLLRAAPGPHPGWSGDVSPLMRAPLPPALYSEPPTCSKPQRYTPWGCNVATIWWLPPEGGATRLTISKTGDLSTMTPCPHWATFQGPCSSCSPLTSPPRCAGSWTAATG